MKKELKRGRESSGELIRIIAMFLIVISHYSTHGTINIYQYSPTPDSSLLYLQLLSMGGNIGLNLFIVVSGYYLYSSEFKYRKLVAVLTHTTLYSLLLYAILGEKSLLGLITALFPAIYNQYWFITGYIGVYLFFPYINRMLKTLDKAEFQKLLIVLFTTMSLIPFVFNTTFILNDFSWFVFIYCVGAYLRRYDLPQFIIRYKALLLTSVFLILCMSVISLHYLGNILPVCRSHATYFNAKESPLILAVVILLFKIIIEFKFESRIINRIGGYTMGVYLIHENPHMRNFLWGTINNEQYSGSLILMIINSIVVTIMIFVAGILVDSVVSLLNKLITHFLIMVKETV